MNNHIKSDLFILKRFLIACFLSISVALLLTNQVAAKERIVKFDHKESNTFDHIVANPGDTIKFTIENTCAEAFSYGVEGVSRAVATVEKNTIQSESIKRECQKTTHVISQTHDQSSSGYYVMVKANGDTTFNTEGLEDRTFFVVVDTSNWDVDFSGGFTLTDLTTPVFTTRKQRLMDGTIQDVIYQDRDAEDKYSLGLAGMVHLVHKNYPSWAGTFGLSITESGDTSYMFGPSVRLGDKATLTAGVMAGKVDRLPNGLQVGDVLTDANGLTNLGQKTETGFFLAISYSFMGEIGQGFFDQQFKPVQGQGN